jgi:hypothetical protein
MTDDDHKDDPTVPEGPPKTLAEQARFLKVKETGEETAKGPILVLKPKARREAITSAATILSLTTHPATITLKNLVADLESLADQTEGRHTDTLRVIIDDSDSTCGQFGYDKGNLTETQAKTMLVQIVSRREIEEQHERELEKIRLQSSMGLLGKWFPKLFGAS